MSFVSRSLHAPLKSILVSFFQKKKIAETPATTEDVVDFRRLLVLVELSGLFCKLMRVSDPLSGAVCVF